MRLSISHSLKEVRHAARVLRQFLIDQGCPEQEVLDWELALAEACNNAIKHSTSGAASSSLELEVVCSETSIEMRLTDHTAGFDWPKEIVLPDVNTESGRGLYLIASVTDRQQYVRGPQGNVLTLTKKRSQRTGAG